MNKIFLLAYTVTFSHLLCAQNGLSVIDNKPFSIGESIELKSEILGEHRKINVYLPSHYKTDSVQRYPVIYLLDGSADEDFIHIAGLVQFGSFSWIKMMPQSIVIGIANVDRQRDFTFPTRNEKDKTDFPTAGGSAKFIDFLASELIPFVDTKYRTMSAKMLIGQSLGGLLATEILFKKPDLFDNYLIVSPSLWWDDESLLNETPEGYKTSKSIYIAVGKEGEIMEGDARSLYQKLADKKNKDVQLFFQYFEKRDHGDVLHLAAYDGLEKIFENHDQN